MTAPITIAAIVVTHESDDVLPACLAALRARAGDADLYMVVSDSGSSVPPAAVSSEYGADLLEGPNQGFGAAVNRALTLPRVAASSWLVVCNADTEVLDGTLASFAKRAACIPRCAAAGPRLLDETGRLIHSIGREPTPADYWLAARTTWADWIWDDAVYANATRADWLAGCFLLLRSDALRAVEGFDEEFFLYSEEVDLCTRLRRSGRRVAYLPSLTVMHRTAERAVDPYLSRLLVWSKLRYAEKWNGPIGTLSMRLALVALHVRQVRQRQRANRDDSFERFQLWAAVRGCPPEPGPFVAGEGRHHRFPSESTL